MQIASIELRNLSIELAVPNEPLHTSPPPAEDSAASTSSFEINRRALLLVAVTALVIAVFAAGYSYRELGNVKRESARRLAELQHSVSTANETATRAAPQ